MLSSALSLFIDWSGHSFSEKEKSFLQEEYRQELTLLYEAFFRPPHENTTTSPEKYLTPFSDVLFQRLANRLGLTPKPFWPNNAPYALCLTHDVDRILATLQRLKKGASMAHVFQDLSSSFKKRRWEENVFYNFQRAYKLFEELKIKTAIYTLFEKRRPLKALWEKAPQHIIGVYNPHDVALELKFLADHGYEIGLHGSFSSWNSSQHLKLEVEQLSKITKKPVYGGRNHYLQFDAHRSLKAFSFNRYLYDSTMGFNFLTGFRVGSCFPYQMGDLLQIPLHLMDTTLWHEYPDQRERLKISEAILDKVRKMGGILMMNWHLQYVNPDAFQDHYELFEKIIKEAKKEGAYIALPHEVAQHWNQRRSQRE